MLENVINVNFDDLQLKAGRGFEDEVEKRRDSFDWRRGGGASSRHFPTKEEGCGHEGKNWIWHY